MRKQVITIQIDPVLLAEVWSWGKDEGLAKQVAIAKLIKYGFEYLLDNPQIQER